ncbi:MAG: phage holin, LLH family [Aristaeellaceae bacterium]
MLAAVITVKVIPWLKSKTTREQQEYLLATVRVLVYAAEQLYGSGKGAAKLQYVQDELEARGLSVDMPAIEAAVREMNLLGSWEVAIEQEVETDDSED